MNTPSRTTLLIIAGIFLVIVVGMILLFFFLGGGNRNSTQQDGDRFSFSSFFGQAEDTLDGFLQNIGGENDNSDETARDTNTATSTQPLLLHIFDRPVSGATFVSLERPIPTLGTSEGSSEKIEIILGVRVIERATGNIFDIPLDTLEKIRVTNTTIPNIHDSFWSADGTYVFTRSANTTDITGIGLSIIPAEEGSGELGTTEALYTYENILDTDINPSGNTLYILRKTPEGSQGVLTSIDGTSPNTIFSSEFSEWLIDWAEDAYVYLTTKPSAFVPGNLYYTSLSNPTLTPLIAGKHGLTTKVNNDGSRVLFSESTDSSLRLGVYSDGEETYPPFDTLPEKCIWSQDTSGIYCGAPFLIPQGAYPDDWYKGIISFTDTLWYVDTETNEGLFLISPEEYDARIDVINPKLSNDESFLLFINKKDMTPWVLDIKGAKERVNY
jgi:hypothetical protein